VVRQIRKSGRVRRGELGIAAQTLTPLLARGMGLPRDWGVIAGDVLPGGPADLSGVLPGDILLAVDGTVMENGRQFDVNIYRHEVGDVVTLRLLRGAEELEKRVPVIERRDDPQRFAAYVTREKNLIPALGILAVEVNKTVASLLPPLRFPNGVLVAARAAESPPGIDPLQPGDVIYTLNGARTNTLSSLRARADTFSPGDAVVLQVERGGALRYVALILD
jgi:S1-C subfamily serine protease